MSSSTPLRCLFSKCTAPVIPSSRRSLHLSGRKLQKKLPKKLPKDLVAAKSFPSYAEKDKAWLKEHYTPAQYAALEAGEAAVDPQDLAQQATVREDPMAIEYIDDFATIHPVIDKPLRAPKENYDPKLRFKTEDEIAEDFAKFMADMPEGATRLDYIKFRDNMRLTVGKEEAERNPRNSLAPSIPKGLAGLKRPGAAKVGEADIDPAMKRLMRQTGLSHEAIRRFRVKNLVVHTVTNQTRLGKIQSMYYLTIAGNGRGLLGIGEGKSTEAEDARRQAHFNAIRNMQPIPRYEDRTIFGDVKVKMGAVELELMTRPPGMYPSHHTSRSLEERILTRANRIRSPLSRQNLRNVSVCWDCGFGRTGHAVEEPDEHDQSDVPGAHESAVAGRGCEGVGEEAGGCEEGILWGECIVLLSCRRCIYCSIAGAFLFSAS